ncbi:hypothetical protein PC112_g10964 [Phytophthora cactorum]|nr:hypothetical protein PC112_g10964 [Phytophthora cactorum]KAG3013727.1 hypothetical protein PC120_g13123 [Phytophthora cactorum]
MPDSPSLPTRSVSDPGAASSPASSPATVLPTADFETPGPDFTGVRTSLDALCASVDCAKELQTRG